MQNSTSSSVSASPPSNAYNPSVFWGVNFIIFTLAVMLILWGMCGSTGPLACFRRRRQRRREEEQTQQQQQQERQQQEATREQMEKYLRTRDTPEQRRQKLEECFQKHNTTMIVTEGDILDEAQLVKTLAIESLEAGNSQPTPLQPSPVEADKDIAIDAEDADIENLATAAGDRYLLLKCEPQPRSVPNCCAVCLSNYDVGDVVVWSPNQTCQHAFHHECILEWLVKMYKQRGLEMIQHNACPCCRQEFAILPEQQPEPSSEP